MDYLKVYDHFGVEQAGLELRMLRVNLPQYLRVFQRMGQFLKIEQARSLQVRP